VGAKLALICKEAKSLGIIICLDSTQTSHNLDAIKLHDPLTNYSWLQVDEDSTGNVLSSSGLREESVE
jgi:hypothetical protein